MFTLVYSLFYSIRQGLRNRAVLQAEILALRHQLLVLQRSAADKPLPDGTRIPDYGSNPHGLAIFTADGYYSIQVYRAERLKFSTGDKFNGTPEEYEDASLSMSVLFGRYSVDPVKGTITLHIDRSSVPNLDDTTQVRPYELKGDTLSWKVPARKDARYRLLFCGEQSRRLKLAPKVQGGASMS